MAINELAPQGWRVMDVNVVCARAFGPALDFRPGYPGHLTFFT